MTTSQNRVPPPREPLQDPNGGVSRPWWRWFNDIFQITGSGQATQNLVQVIENVTNTSDLTYAAPNPSGRIAELERRLAGLESMLLTAPAARNIAELERRLTMLETMVSVTQTPKVDLVQIRRDIDRLAAYTLGTH